MPDDVTSGVPALGVAAVPRALDDLAAPAGSDQPRALAAPTTPYQETRYDPTRARERMRGAIAVVLLSILAGVVLFAFVGLWTQRVGIEDTRVLLEILFAPLVGLVGAATGFYYGSRAGQE